MALKPGTVTVPETILVAVTILVVILIVVTVGALPKCPTPPTNRQASESSLTAPPSLPARQVPAASPTPFRKPPAPRASRSAASRQRRPQVLPLILLKIRSCESGDGKGSYNYRARNKTSSASGAYQFLDSTWRSTTSLPPPASAYSPAVQDRAALTLYRRSGTRPWNPSRSCWA